MKYDDPDMRDLIAVEYVLGHLRGQARARFLRLTVERTDWRDALKKALHRVHLLADTVPAVLPNERVWQTIQSKLYGNPDPIKDRIGTQSWLGWWQAIALSTSSVAAVLALLLLNQAPQPHETPIEMVEKAPASTSIALLSTPQATPGWIVTLVKNNDHQTEIRISTLASLTPANANAFELWLLPQDKSAPVSLGLLPQQGGKQLVVSAELAAQLLESSMAVSLEPQGGSPTGQPTGAVLYQGKFTQI